MTDAPPPPDVAADLAHFIATRRTDCIPHPRPTPNVLYHITAIDALADGATCEYECGGTVSLRDFAAAEGVDLDDEPWGDPVGLGMPRPRMTLLRALWHIATAKYRRVI